MEGIKRYDCRTKTMNIFDYVKWRGDVPMSMDPFNEVEPSKAEQFSAVTYHLADGTYYVAFRGTDNTVTGWKECFNLSYMNETEGQRRAVEYLNRIRSIFHNSPKR